MKQRVISAIVAAVIVIPILIIGGIPFALGIGVLAALALHEVMNLNKKDRPYTTLMKVLGFVSLELLVFNRYDGGFINLGVNNLAICLPALALLIPSIFYKNDEYTTKDAFYLFGAVMVLGTFFNALIVMCNTPTGMIAGQWKLLYLFLIASMTDTFAMIIGCLIGKHKLIPRVSPKKSIEGSIAGSVVGTAIASIYYYNIIGDLNIFVLIGMTLLLSILGQIGDLFFSKIKREHDIKDFSNIMPGHGGILDRLDSFTFIVFGYIAITSILSIIIR